ncbi:hypothetical protein [Streptomyces sp. NPDC001843]|uniref:hypothetical protein n=1 Tax=Streptomyces sp. NPDC001843 TaxID=3364617 RepID=UPI0036A9E2B8
MFVVPGTPGGEAAVMKMMSKTDNTAQGSAVTSKWVVVQLKYIGKKVAQHRQGKWVVYTSYLEG